MLWLFAEEWIWMALATLLGTLLGWWLRGRRATTERLGFEADVATARRSAEDAAAGKTRLEGQLADANRKISTGAASLTSFTNQEAEKDKVQDGEIARLRAELDASRTAHSNELATVKAAGAAALTALIAKEAEKDKQQDGEIAKLRVYLESARRAVTDKDAELQKSVSSGTASLSSLTQQEKDKDKLQDGEIARLRTELDEAQRQAFDDLQKAKTANAAALAALVAKEADKDKVQDGEIARLRTDLEACRRHHAEKDAELEKYRKAAAALNEKLPTFLDRPRGVPDDLKLIKGVGEKLNTLLTSIGIFHFRQIANWTQDEIAQVDAKMENFKGRIVRDEWLPQAKLLAEGKHQEFEAKYGKMGENN
jgi:predicted flap endonuclease-1-like 5' DNA nuclease